jgi:G3E family GTPase
MAERRDRIPVHLLTGFLGSGKTTLLGRLLAHPGFGDTAVLINELGEVGLDQHLVWGAGETALVLENGCICCTVRDDLVGVLEELFWSRLHRKIPRFARVVIETTGVADPGPILRTLLTDSFLAERYRLDTVVCAVDSTLTKSRLERHPEAAAQLALADVLVLTKTDLASGEELQALEAELPRLNPLARVQRAAMGEIDPDVLLAAAPQRAERAPPAAGGGWSFLRNTGEAGPGTAQAALGRHARIRTFTVVFDRPHAWTALEGALKELAASCGERLLRAKGLVEVAGEAGPVVVQMVRDQLFPPQRLAAWPEGEAASALVFITLDLDPGKLRAQLEARLHEG